VEASTPDSGAIWPMVISDAAHARVWSMASELAAHIPRVLLFNSLS